MRLLFWIGIVLAGLLVVFGLLCLAERAGRSWEQHEARRRRQWEAKLAARRKPEP